MKVPSANVVNKRFAEVAPKLNELAGKVCDKHILSAYCCMLKDATIKQPLDQAQLDALACSTEHLMGQTLTRQLLVSNAWRVLANFHFIMEGMAIPVWEGDRTETQVVFLGLEKKRQINKGKLYLQVQIKLRSGLPAGIITWSRFTNRQISFFLQRQSGCKSFNPAVEEISGMQASLMVELQGDDLRVVDWKCTADEKKFNRQLTEARRDPRKCSTFMPCNTCPKTIKECPLAIWLPEER